MSILGQPTPPEWVFYAVRPTGANIGALAAARTRRLSFALDGPASVTFTMPGDHPETVLIDDLSTDVICGRNGVALFRGRIGANDDTLSATVHTSTFAALDYRGMLGRRILWSGVRRSFRAADQADIAWALIADSQALPGGDWGITRGNAPPTGILRDRDYDPGKNLGEALDQLGRVIDPASGTAPAFEWEIDPQRRFNLFYPRRGRQSGLVLTYGREVTDLRRAVNPAAYANAIRYNGADGTDAVELAVDDFLPDRGRWDGQRSDPNLILQSTVDERAAFELETASALEASFSVAMAAGLWDPNDLWLGDTARLIIRGGRLDVDVTRRIIGVDIELSDDGGETVRLAVAAAEPALTGRLQSYDSRLKDLERGGDYIPDLPVGAMYDWPGRTPPQLYLWADGALLDRRVYPELFAVLGFDYGGDSDWLFALPNLSGRFTLGASTFRPAGSTGGAESVALDGIETGVHGHTFEVASGPDTSPHHHAIDAGTVGETAHTHSGGTGPTPDDHIHGVPLQYVTNVAPGDIPVIGPAAGVGVNTLGISANHQHPFTTGGANQGHAHSVIADTGGAIGFHGHGVGGVTHAGGNGLPHENMPPYLAIGKVIKVVSAQNQYLRERTR